jgi:hypothetical protein
MVKMYAVRLTDSLNLDAFCALSEVIARWSSSDRQSWIHRSRSPPEKITRKSNFWWSKIPEWPVYQRKTDPRGLFSRLVIYRGNGNTDRRLKSNSRSLPSFLDYS